MSVRAGLIGRPVVAQVQGFRNAGSSRRWNIRTLPPSFCAAFARELRRPRSGGDTRCGHVDARSARRRRDPRGYRHRPRRPVVPKRSLRRIQDRRRHRARSARPVLAPRGCARVGRFQGLPYGRTRSRRRHGRRRLERQPQRQRAWRSTKSSSARRTRTSVSAWSGPASCSSIDAKGS